MTDLFVYGTMMSHDLMATVSGARLAVPVPAILPDHAVFSVAGDVVPFIAPQPGKQAQGLIWTGLPEAAMQRLNTYEAAFGYALHALTVTVNGMPRTVHGYLPPVDRRPGAGVWSFEDWESTHLAPAIHAAREVLSLDPKPDESSLRQMWPMIESRAWARHRARQAPATIRRAAVAGDTDITPATPASGVFFRFQGFDVSHAKFDGTRSPVLRREIFVGVDAAMLLPYDPVRDRVLLLEQLRVGPMVRHDPNPWMLEPVAGIVDAREDPKDAALREAMEEARIAIRTLVPAGEYYPSPGATTDYFYAYVGLCDLTADVPYNGGLVAEAEDIRLHPMQFDAAMALADSGEISTGPLLHLLLWLARHRDRLRATG